MNAEKTATPPVFVDMGKTRRKRIKELKRGEGPLMSEVRDVIEEVKTQLGDELDGKIIVPVVIVYKEKKSRRSGLLSFLEK